MLAFNRSNWIRYVLLLITLLIGVICWAKVQFGGRSNREVNARPQPAVGKPSRSSQGKFHSSGFSQPENSMTPAVSRHPRQIRELSERAVDSEAVTGTAILGEGGEEMRVF